MVFQALYLERLRNSRVGLNMCGSNLSLMLLCLLYVLRSALLVSGAVVKMKVVVDYFVRKSMTVCTCRSFRITDLSCDEASSTWEIKVSFENRQIHTVTRTPRLTESRGTKEHAFS
jgi:hypothetical protein